jgi:preprotein translocase subunit SecA
MGFFEKLFDSNERDIARLRKEVVAINAFEQRAQAMSEQQMRDRIDAIRTEIREQSDKLGYTAMDKEHVVINPKIEALMKQHLPEVFALCREASVRTLGLRNFDVQMIASIALHEGRISEQKTGEGKTLTAVPALVLNGLTGRGSHLITVNDYLSKHGAEWMGPIYRLLGVSVGVLQHSTPIRGRQDVYSQEVVYGTNNEYGFDYLRDNMVIHAKDMVQGELNFGIVDECDSILIDEARTPLIISGTSNEDTALYSRVDSVIRRLSSKDITGEDKPKDIFEQAFNKKYDDESGKEWDYEYDRKHHHASLTPRGIDKVEKALDDVLVLDPNDDNPHEKNLFSYANTEIAHYVQQALRAHGLYENEVQYVVKDGEVIIVDEFTGRLMFGRRYSEGLHQAIEAKEGLEVAPESQTLATITIQNYFRQYHKLAGMTGTAKTEEDEFKKIYGMDVVVVPTNRAVTRKDVADVVYKSEKGKYDAIVDDVAERYKKGQPVLVGTVSIEKSERLASLMQKKGVPCKVLNAKYHEQEAYLVAQAGRPGTVTVATNMAGRGTDIILGGNPEFAAREELRGMGLDPEEHDDEFRALVARLKPEYEQHKQQVLASGGLYVLGSERHESRRIDNQLRGRSGRQGDPGESRFFLSLQDDLMKMYGGERVEKLMEFLKIEEDMPIESGMLTKAIENAQKKVEGRNFDIRKHTLQYDDVMNKQRQVIYGERRRILEGGSLKESVLEFIDNAVTKVVEDATARHGRDASIDYEALIESARASFPIGELNADDLEGKSPEDITAMFKAKVHNLYDQKELEIGRAVLLRMNPAMDQAQLEQHTAEAGATHMREIERVVTLKSIDENWIEHLNMLDHLRSGVSLRGYGQQDPVVVYAQEAFAAFDQLKQDIQLDVIRKMFLVRIEAPVVERKSAYNIQAQGQGQAGGGQLTPGGTTESGQRIAVKSGPKLGRNVKCYCGSGKKYKQCHLPLDGGEAPDNWPELYEKAYGESAPVG